jgi:hypothetical protein
MRPGRLAALAIGGLFLVSSAHLDSAGAERAQTGNLLVSADAQLMPSELPRTGTAPVSTRFAASFATSDGSRLPRLRRIAIVMGARGQFDTSLPRCRVARIRNTTAAQALRACGSALVGHGRMGAALDLPGQHPTGFDGRILAFNGVAEDGTPTVIGDVFSKAPPVSFLMSFRIRPVPGAFATALVANLHASGKRTHLRHFELTLGRRFEKGGRMHSFVNAACPAPRGFRSFPFTFAEATFDFAGDKSVSTAVTRSCRVRGE